MKKLMLLMMIFLSVIAFANSPDASVDEELWKCEKGDNKKVILVYKTNESYKHSSETVLFINDQQICDALAIACPYEGGVYQINYHYFPHFNGKYIYTSVKGKYEDGVIFYSSDGGMKINSLYTGSNPGVNWNKNWFFNEGECVKLLSN